MNGPNLSFLQRPGVREGLMQTGMAMMAQSDQPYSTFLGNLGRALPAGVEAGRAASQQADYEAMLEGLPPEQATFLKMLGRDRGLTMLAQQAMAGPPKPDFLEGREGEFFRGNPDGTMTQLTTPPAETVTPTANQRDFEFFQTLSPEQQAAYTALHGPGPGVTVNTGDKAAGAAAGAFGSDAASRIISSSKSAEAAVGIMSTVAQADALLQRPEAQQVTGPGATIFTLRERFRDNPAAREIAAQFDVLTSDIMLQTIDSFEGALSDKELAFIERASAADRNMTVEELRAGLDLLRRIAERDVEAYVTEFDAFNPAAFDVAPEQMQQYRALRDRAGVALQGDIYAKYPYLRPPG